MAVRRPPGFGLTIRQRESILSGTMVASRHAKPDPLVGPVIPVRLRPPMAPIEANSVGQGPVTGILTNRFGSEEMITLLGRGDAFCDGVSRRSFVSAGLLSLGGLTLPRLLQSRAQAGAESAGSNRSVIFLELAGGPTQFETYDPKPEAPAEYRGAFGPIETNLPGVRFCELMPEQARILDKLAIIRSVHHGRNSHDPSSHLTQTGYYKEGKKGGPNSFPCVGSVTARLRGANREGMPAYVAVPKAMRNGKAAFAGQGFNPFETGGDPNKRDFQVDNLGLVDGLTIDQLDDRHRLRQAFDSRQRLLDRSGVADSLDEYAQRAYELVASGAARRAFDIGQEVGALRERYGRNTVGQSMLLARRLVEAGVTFVTVRVTGWDDHTKIANRLRSKCPNYDRGVASLVTDLYERGLDKDTLVVAMGEFGRTPRVNRNAGRDHWGAVMSVLISGGGLRTGQIIGSSNRKGEVPASNPYRPENVLAMVYRHLGIDPATLLADYTGRPRYLLECREPIPELI